MSLWYEKRMPLINRMDVQKGDSLFCGEHFGRRYLASDNLAEYTVRKPGVTAHNAKVLGRWFQVSTWDRTVD
jgi:hypothetical protein